jgi:hypothetical protein
MNIVRVATIPWQANAYDGGEIKTLVDRGVGRLLVQALRFGAGARLEPTFLAALVVEGSADVNGETLGTWAFVYADEGDARASMNFAQGATLLALTLR